MPADVPRLRVHANQDIAWELYDRGVVEPVESPLVVKGRELVNGAFGVAKPNKHLADDRPVLRLIMDFRAVNSVTRLLEGDIRSLTSAPSLQHIALPEGKLLRLSADDLCAALYLFVLRSGGAN